MDKNTWIGFLLIAAIIVGFFLYNRPSKEELAERQRIHDSIAYQQQLLVEAQQISDAISAEMSQSEDPTPIQQEVESVLTELENEKIKLYIDSKGGRIARVDLKEYKAYGDTVNDLCMFDGEESSLSFTLITSHQRILATKNLSFEPIKANDSTLIMRYYAPEEEAWLDFIYILPANDYIVRYSIQAHNMLQSLAQNMNSLEMHWEQVIPQQERGYNNESKYSQLQYMLVGGDIEELNANKSDSKKETGKIRWIAYKDQFFSTVMIADDAFMGTELESAVQPQYSGYIKAYQATTSVAFDLSGAKPTSFRYYFGPNHYNTLKAYDKDKSSEEKLHLKALVPLGWKIVAWINMLIVIPLFDLFMSWGLHIGIVILLLTLVIKLIILPFVFASYRSSAKMRVLKPKIDEINARFKPEQMQERQQATMTLYQQAGVSPMSGCLPMLFQFPVLVAMFWFLPTAIELRGQSLWWADDLSTYDAIVSWGFPIWGIGDHLSLFCLLMTVANFGYTFITMQQQASDPNMKIMKWMMYLMPLMFLFIFNNYAAGLSYYYLLSLGFTIIQTMIFRWSINDEELLAEMEANARRKANKPKSGFMQRLEQMQREQQKLAREQAKANSKKYR